MTCLLADCDQPDELRGLCRRDYHRLYRCGELEQFALKSSILSYSESFTLAQAAETDEGCHPWPKIGKKGYPTTVTLDGAVVNAHVKAWVDEHGPIPDGLTIDHLCHTNSLTCRGGPLCPHRRCVRTLHMELVTPLEQTRRSYRYRRPTCASGEHLRNDENTAWYLTATGYWSRRCAPCDRKRALDRKRGDSPYPVRQSWRDQ